MALIRTFSFLAVVATLFAVVALVALPFVLAKAVTTLLRIEVGVHEGLTVVVAALAFFASVIHVLARLALLVDIAEVKVLLVGLVQLCLVGQVPGQFPDLAERTNASLLKFSYHDSPASSARSELRPRVLGLRLVHLKEHLVLHVLLEEGKLLL